VSAGARASIEPSTWGNTMYGVLERPPRTGIGAGVQVLEPEGSNQALQGFLILGGCPSSRLMVTMSGSPLASNQRKEKTGPPPVALPSLKSNKERGGVGISAGGSWTFLGSSSVATITPTPCSGRASPLT
jgi:hypothetical protein